jgi:hypothetical protein
MGISYYDALLPVREPGADLRDVVAGIGLPYRVLASVRVPAGRIVLGFAGMGSPCGGARWRGPCRPSVLIAAGSPAPPAS